MRLHLCILYILGSGVYLVPWYEPPLVPRIPEHGVGLAAARLTVGEAARVEPVQDMVHLHKGTGTRNRGKKGQLRVAPPTAVGG